MSAAQRIPVLVYHSVADDHAHPWSFLSLPVSIFERQLRYLKRAGFNTVTLYDIHAHMRDGSPLPPRAIALTFDDGYLDNWVHVYPLLKRYGMRATIFVPTDFVDPRPVCRPTLEDVWAGRIAREELEWWGYASWTELARMAESGHVDVQSHTRTHTWYAASDRIVDFHHPGDGHVWLWWNAHREDKPAWLSRPIEEEVPWGTPVHAHELSLPGRLWLEDPALAEVAIEHVRRHGARDYFRRPGWREELVQEVERYRAAHPGGGRYETDEERTARLRDELEGSRRILQEKLGRPVDFLCWPCGDYTPELHRFAVEDCGYLATVNTRKTWNMRGGDPTQVNRSYFGQEYRGPCKAPIILLNFYGTVNHQTGRRWAWPLAPLSRRLMKIGRLFA